jgi:hypothetical protein
VPAAAARVSYTGPNALLSAEDCALLLIDHQGAQFANLHSHEHSSWSTMRLRSRRLRSSSAVTGVDIVVDGGMKVW